MSSVMEISEILDRISRVTGRFEREAVEAAIVRQDEITPELLQIHKLLLRFARLPGDLLDSICGNFLDGGFAIALERTVRAEIAISAFVLSGRNKYLCRRENRRRGAGGSVPNSQSTVN